MRNAGRFSDTSAGNQLLVRDDSGIPLVPNLDLPVAAVQCRGQPPAIHARGLIGRRSKQGAGLLASGDARPNLLQLRFAIGLGALDPDALEHSCASRRNGSYNDEAASENATSGVHRGSDATARWPSGTRRPV